MRARWNTNTSCSAPEGSYGSSGRNRSAPGKSNGSPRKSYDSAVRSRSIRPEWCQMSGGFSRIPQRLAGFNAFRRPNRVNNACFSAARFKTSDLPPLIWTQIPVQSRHQQRNERFSATRDATHFKSARASKLAFTEPLRLVPQHRPSVAYNHSTQVEYKHKRGRGDAKTRNTRPSQLRRHDRL